MRAVRLDGARSLSLIEADDPAPRDGEVLVRVAACGICGSDLSCYKTGVFAPVVLGHEIAGTVVAGDGWAPGTPVVVDPKVSCGACRECASDNEHRCVDALTKGIGQIVPGGFAEHVLAPSERLYAIPPTLDLVTAALAEPLAVALHGLSLAAPAQGPAVVFGLGPIGLLTIAALRDAQAGPVIGVDPVAGRRALAERLGARVVEPGADAIAAAEAVLVIETSGNARAVADAGNAVAPGGTVLLLGIPMSSVEVWPMVWVTREVRLVGSISHVERDWHAALDLLARTPSVGDLITERIDLHDVPAAFERLITAADAGKIVAVPG